MPKRSVRRRRSRRSRRRRSPQGTRKQSTYRSTANTNPKDSQVQKWMALINPVKGSSIQKEYDNLIVGIITRWESDTMDHSQAPFTKCRTTITIYYVLNGLRAEIDVSHSTPYEIGTNPRQEHTARFLHIHKTKLETIFTQILDAYTTAGYTLPLTEKGVMATIARTLSFSRRKRPPTTPGAVTEVTPPSES